MSDKKKAGKATLPRRWRFLDAFLHLRAFDALRNVTGHIRGGRIRPLAVDGAMRSPLFPDVPTLVEAGYRGVANRIWLGILGPAGIPKPIVARLNSEISRIAVEGIGELVTRIA